MSDWFCNEIFECCMRESQTNLCLFFWHVLLWDQFLWLKFCLSWIYYLFLDRVQNYLFVIYNQDIIKVLWIFTIQRYWENKTIVKHKSVWFDRCKTLIEAFFFESSTLMWTFKHTLEFVIVVTKMTLCSI